MIKRATRSGRNGRSVDRQSLMIENEKRLIITEHFFNIMVTILPSTADLMEFVTVLGFTKLISDIKSGSLVEEKVLEKSNMVGRHSGLDFTETIDALTSASKL